MKVIYDIAVKVIGVKKRCRNVDEHSFKLEEIDFKELSSEDVELYTVKAKELLKQNMKETERAILCFTRVKVGDFMRQIAIPDPAHKKFNIELDTEC